jgi:hypothetical protein
MRALLLIVAIPLVAAATTAANAAPLLRVERGVTIASASDDSPGVLDAHARKRHGQIVRRALHDVLQRAGADVRYAGIGTRRGAQQIDAAVVGWRVAQDAAQLSVSAELRVVVCDERGKMVAIVTGRASVSSPVRGARLAELREQALAEAIGAMGRRLSPALALATS